MALTNFNSLTNREIMTWSRDFWKAARNNSAILSMAGTGPNACFQKIKDLRKGQKGAEATITLVADLITDGITGDNQLEGNEEAINAYDMEIRLDQLRNANVSQGKMSEQAHVVDFRNASKDVLAYWMGDRIDQLGFLTLSGVTYDMHNNGADRPDRNTADSITGGNLTDLAFAADVSAPSTNRHVRWDSTANSGAGALVAGDTSSVIAADQVTYKTLVRLKALAKTRYVRGIRANGKEYFHVWMTPDGMANLRLDQDFLENQRHAGPRGAENELFKGADVVTVDGLIIHEHRHVYNTGGATSGDKWGATGTVDGERILMCGAQALALADIGAPTWEEDYFDYKNRPGISIGKIFGMKKSKLHSIYAGGVEDFGVIACDVAL